MVYICTKFHENILNGIRVMEQTRKVNGRTDGRPDRRTDRGHDIIRPVFDGRMKMVSLTSFDLKGKCDHFICKEVCVRIQKHSICFNYGVDV